MSTPKAELRKIILGIILGNEPVTYDPTQFGHLTAGVAEVLSRQRSGQGYSSSVFQPEQRLNEDDWQIVQEIFWDLVCERAISQGLNSSNPNFPWFRVHPEAAAKLK